MTVPNIYSYDKFKLGIRKSRQLSSTLRMIQETHTRLSDDYFNFNVTRSDEIPVTRDIMDARPSHCINRKFNYSSFPTVSIVSPIYNEALTPLLRHVHALLARTPPTLLRDIILVDDNSTFTYLGSDLERYFRILDPRIKIIRNSERKGLILSRMSGAARAKGEVVIFLDAHMEVCEGWLEPLLERINEHEEIVLQADITAIDGNTFDISTSAPVTYRGGFCWNMGYKWFPLPDYFTQLPRTAWDPLPVPILQGSCIVIRRSYLYALGGFDTGLQIWGGEHFEMSFNVWMTGGRIETVPCSKVGHVFKSNKYSFGVGGKNDIVAKNDLRVAEVWMDDYKGLVRAAVRGWHYPEPTFTESDWRSIRERQAMRKRRGSKSFNWYLKHVFPEITIPKKDDVYHGEVTNELTKRCFYVTEDGYVGLTQMCQTFITLVENTFSLDKYGRLTGSDGRCVGVDASNNLLTLSDCALLVEREHRIPQWSLANGRLVITTASGSLCATEARSNFNVHQGEQVVQLQACDTKKAEQKWYFNYHLVF